ncbi:MAG: hypothetical protein GY754_27655 [bacterium]|nr:hypothetical protein [bacterium]
MKKINKIVLAGLFLVGSFSFFTMCESGNDNTMEGELKISPAVTGNGQTFSITADKLIDGSASHSTELPAGDSLTISFAKVVEGVNLSVSAMGSVTIEQRQHCTIMGGGTSVFCSQTDEIKINPADEYGALVTVNISWIPQVDCDNLSSLRTNLEDFADKLAAGYEQAANPTPAGAEVLFESQRAQATVALQNALTVCADLGRRTDGVLITNPSNPVGNCSNLTSMRSNLESFADTLAAGYEEAAASSYPLTSPANALLNTRINQANGYLNNACQACGDLTGRIQTVQPVF